jgi:hypothetical protein
LLSDAADSIRRQDPDPPHWPDDPHPSGRREPLRVLGFASNSVADELALGMLAGLLDHLPITIEITSARMQASDVVSLVQARGISVVCFADLPPSPPAKTRYLVKRASCRVAGRTDRRRPSSALSDESTHALRESGAHLVASTLADTRRYLGELVELPRGPAPEASTIDAA